MSANAKLAPPPTANGVITAPPMAGGNRKKQKRRAKQAAKQAQQVPMPPAEDSTDVGYDEDALRYDDDEEDYSDEGEPEEYDDDPHYAHQNGAHSPPLATGKKNKKKKKHAVGHGHHSAYDPDMLPPMPAHAHPGAAAVRPPPRSGQSNPNIWNTSTQQERQNIKEFWLSLSEDERKGLLKIEKEAVLKKMKQQQKHSCSCTVCGRKRTAIEEELEVLYEGYYEELEQYAHHDHPPLPSTDGMMPDPLQHRQNHPLNVPPPTPHPHLHNHNHNHHHHHHHPHPHHKTSHMHEHLGDEDEFSEEEEEEEYSEDEDYDSEEDDEPHPEPLPPRAQAGVPDFFNFGSHLTVKGILTPWVEKLKAGLKGNADNLLTVADDLLKNDGRKFIEMMEQLAERRMQRESRSQYEAETHSGYPPDDPGYAHEDPLAAGEEFDDDDGSYDSQDDYEDDIEEEDEMVGDIQMASRDLPQTDHSQGGLTEEQRMQEGRRMFQIFAARMFEQRVLTAYREKVAAERQRKLLEELDDEDKLQAQREAKKQRDAQKKKDKKKQQQLAKAEEKAKRDAEKADEERKLREAEEKRLDEQRRKKEEQRKKREEEKKKLEEEKARKEGEKLRRQQEEQQRREDAERKAREQKAAEKAKREEQKKREREEREAREKEARERKLQEDREKKEREAKVKAEKEAKEREKTPQQAAHPPQIQKRPSQPGMVAIPGVYPKQTPSGISSPHPQIATPAIPKAPTPAKQRQASQQGSLASSPKQAQSQLSSAPSKSSSPGSNAPQTSVQPKTIMQKPGNQQPGQQNQHPISSASPLHQQPLQPPPGMPHPQHHGGGFGGMPPMGFPGFQGPQGPMIPSMAQRGGPMGMFPHQGPPPMGMPNRMSFPGMNGMPPPGMMAPQGRGYPFDGPGQNQPPPGFNHHPMPQQNQTSPIGTSPTAPGSENQRQSMSGHSRQQSSDKERFESAANQPIARPAPIQRPSSVKPQGPDRTGSTDLDDLSKHLGSSALLDDSDEPIPPNVADNRRHSNIPAASRNITMPAPGIGQIGGFGPPGGFGTPASNWNTPGMPFGQSPGLPQPGWGSLPTPGMSSWANNNAPFGGAGFGSIGGSIGAAPMHRPGVGLSRPLTIRLAVCQACKQLSQANRGEGDGFHNVDVLLHQIEANRPMLDSPPTLRELEEICETEGDSQNGGGELHVRKDDGSNSFAVKWEADAGTPDQGRGNSGLGEIGSPMPSRPSPATGFGAPGMPIGRAPGMLPNLGAVVGSSNPS
ncbi:hypothetical protein PRZ48_014887 [Zasmidium cellare]|uniref:Stress response protein NST1 n=1 Tax=Zasmidium cellare TaxID=395010 RepID=A0ABR0DX40_ZASCE|nr:hypothetical protein PRZ48_014887 [Zasmidium cellare]